MPRPRMTATASAGRGRRIGLKNNCWLSAVYDSHVSRLRGHCRRRGVPPVDTDDVVQETFARLCAGGEKRLARVDDVGQWLRGIANHLIVDGFRRRSVRREVTGDLPSLPARPAWDAEGREFASRLTAEIARLPEPERNALTLQQSGLRYAEIAARLHTTPNAVAIRVYRARETLRSRMRDLRPWA